LILVAETSLRRAWKPLVVGLALGLLLIPTATSQRALFPGIVCLPLVVLGYRERDDRAFRWWTAYAAGFIAFIVLRSYADQPGVPPAASYALEIDRRLGFGILPSLRLQAAYDPAHPGVVAWLASERGLVPPIHRIVEDTLYPGLFQYGLHVAGGNDFAAMPSVHLAVTTVLGLAFGGRAAVAVTLAMGWALVFTGEHYLIDVLVGLGIVMAIWPLTRKLVPRTHGVPDAVPASTGVRSML
jgi:membrane-associated phospholipid phosphatase